MLNNVFIFCISSVNVDHCHKIINTANQFVANQVNFIHNLDIRTVC